MVLARPKHIEKEHRGGTNTYTRLLLLLLMHSKRKYKSSLLQIGGGLTKKGCKYKTHSSGFKAHKMHSTE